MSQVSPRFLQLSDVAEVLNIPRKRAYARALDLLRK